LCPDCVNPPEQENSHDDDESLVPSTVPVAATATAGESGGSQTDDSAEPVAQARGEDQIGPTDSAESVPPDPCVPATPAAPRTRRARRRTRARTRARAGARSQQAA
jgi:hypothetical protein